MVLAWRFRRRILGGVKSSFGTVGLFDGESTVVSGVPSPSKHARLPVGCREGVR
jgi:hypothetical protein